MEAKEQPHDVSPIFDSLDIDLLVKVLSHTAFSKAESFACLSTLMVNLLGPFFLFFIPVFYVFQGAKLTDRIVVLSASYYVAVSCFCAVLS